MSTGAAWAAAGRDNNRGRAGWPALPGAALTQTTGRRQHGQEMIHLRRAQTLPAELPGHQVPSPPLCAAGGLTPVVWYLADF